MQQKRRFIRFEMVLKVTYYIAQKEPKILKSGTAKEISAGGIRLLTEERLEPGTKLNIILNIPEAPNPVHLNGRVLWSKDTPSAKGLSYSSGIEFGDIEEDNKNTFLKFLCDMMYKKTGKKESIAHREES